MEEEVIEISLEKIFWILWRKLWLIILCMVIGAGIGYGVSVYLIHPTYESWTSMYVNNSKNRGESELNINDINASQKLVATYIEILNSETVLNQVIEQIECPYSTSQLRNMITSRSVNDTEILEVKVTCQDPQMAADIAKALVEVGTPEIIRVVQAGDVQVIDWPKVSQKPVEPNVHMNTVVGSGIGVVLVVGIIILIEILDNRVKESDDLAKRFNIPVIGVVPHGVRSTK